MICRRKTGRLAAVYLIGLVCAVVILPLALQLEGNATVGGFWEAPSLSHPLGTDDVGRDLLARVLLGGRSSLLVAAGAAVLSVGLGVPLGLLAGYRRGGWEFCVMRAADVCQAFPSTVLILCLSTISRTSVWTLILVLGLLGWGSIARLVYAGTLRVRELGYVDAARLSGVKGWRLLWREILPNVIDPVIPAAALRAGRAILTESSMSFLGVGIRPPEASWGNIIHGASQLSVLATRPWVWLVPGLLIIFTVLSFNALGEQAQARLRQEVR